MYAIETMNMLRRLEDIEPIHETKEELLVRLSYVGSGIYYVRRAIERLAKHLNEELADEAGNSELLLALSHQLESLQSHCSVEDSCLIEETLKPLSDRTFEGRKRKAIESAEWAIRHGHYKPASDRPAT